MYCRDRIILGIFNAVVDHDIDNIRGAFSQDRLRRGFGRVEGIVNRRCLLWLGMKQLEAQRCVLEKGNAQAGKNQVLAIFGFHIRKFLIAAYVKLRIFKYLSQIAANPISDFSRKRIGFFCNKCLYECVNLLMDFIDILIMYRLQV